ncbi:unnamed protein product [Porites lobata]|uniref:Large ribosomal subunit protein mL49 n=1 Tax=Porites lobata TaxID=104759 RepID=A0ABN8PC11_9CNID|nr:unnamed protein product [Porites lobata]
MYIITRVKMATARSLCKVCRSFLSTNVILQSQTGQRSAKTASHLKKSTQTTNRVTYIIKPERLKQIEESPSGWVPPATESPNLPFFIKRSKFNNLPVYSDYKRGGNYKLTVIRKIKGDLQALDDCLRHHLGKDINSQINELTSQVKIKGIHKDAVVTVLKRLGF